MTSQRTTNQAASCLTGNRWAMMSGWGSTGSGMMNGGRMMGGMWGAMGTMGMMGFSAATAQPITEAEAQQRLATFAADCGADVHVADVRPSAAPTTPNSSTAPGPVSARSSSTASPARSPRSPVRT